MKLTIRSLTTAVDWAGAFLLVATGCVVFVDVLNRNIFGLFLPWAGEFAGYLMVWFAFVAGASAVTRREHLRIEYLQAVLPPRRALALRVIEQVAAVVFYVFLAFYGFQFALLSLGRQAVTLRFSMFVPTVALAVGGALMAILEAANLALDLKAIVRAAKPTQVPAPAQEMPSAAKPASGRADGGR